MKFLSDLVFLSVDIMLDYFEKSSNKKALTEAAITTHSQRKATQTTTEAKEEEMNRQCAIRYLREAKRNKQNLIENVKDLL